MSDKEGMYFTVRLGEFNTRSTIDGRVYNLDKATLEEFLKKKIGKPIGEIRTDAIRELDGELTDQMRRVTTVVTSNSAGILRGYDIAENEGALIATGHVDFSPELKKQIDLLNDTQPTFGVRAIVRITGPDEPRDVLDLVCFDYVDPAHRM